MRSDLDTLLHRAGMEGLLVLSEGAPGPAMSYFCGGVNPGTSLLLKLRDQPPVLYHGSMEREEAALTGLQTVNLQQAGWSKSFTREAGELFAAELERRNAHGTFGLYGQAEVGATHAFLTGLQQSTPDVRLALEDPAGAVLHVARSTKDSQEIERMRLVARGTVSVVGNVVDFLTSHRAQDGRLVNQQGEPLTVAEVKRRINLWLAMKDLENPEGTIFVVGRETAYPHSTGRPDQPIPLGTPILLDIFPRQAGGGFFYDFTRTWSLGHADERLESTHRDVADVFASSVAALRPGLSTRELQNSACDLFEGRGHPTLRSHPKTTDGYVHSLGHGVGLNVHELPSMRHLETENSILQPGMVFTLEPGLYFPEQGFGVRLENTFVMGADGQAAALAEFPQELVLRAPGW